MLLLLLVLQADSPRELVEKLRSDRVEERDDAARKLKAMGPSAAPELERAMKDADSELALRAKVVHQWIRIDGTFTPAIKKAHPGLIDRLSQGDAHTWTEVFLETGERALSNDLHARDLLPVARLALVGATSASEKDLVCEQIITYSLYPAVPDVEKLLADPSGAVRARAVDTLSALGAVEKAPLLATFLDDPHADVRLQASYAMGNLHHRGAIPALVARLKDADDDVRESAAQALGDLGAKEAAGDLEKLLADKTVDVAEAAVIALGKLRALGSAAQVARFLRHENPRVRFEAATSLARMGAKESAPLMVPLLEDDWQEVRIGVLEALARLGAREQAKAVAGRLEDDVQLVRESAARVLVRLGARDLFPSLVADLRENPRTSGRESSAALVQLGAKGAIPSLLLLMDSEDADRRAVAIEALAGLDAKEVQAVLVRRLEDPDNDVVRSAALGLRRLGTREAATSVIPLLGRARPYAREQAAVALGGLGAREAVGPLRAAFYREDGTPSQAVISALAELGAREGVPDLLKCLKTGRTYDRLIAARALSDLGASEAEPAVGASLEEGIADDPRWILETAATIAPDRAVTSARKFLKHGDGEVRLASAGMLGELGGRESGADLLPLLRDPEIRVRSAALQALASLGYREAAPSIREGLERDHLERAVALGALMRLGLKDPMEELLLLVRDEHEGTCVEAMKVLTRLHLREAVPEIRRWLMRRGTIDRGEVADCLCRLGSGEGAPALLAEAAKGLKDRLFCLNALRRPGTWERLRTRSLPEPMTGTAVEILERLAREGNLTLDLGRSPLSESSPLCSEAWKRRRLRVGAKPLLDVLEQVVDLGRYEAILEDQRLRIVPREEGWAFWMDWGAEEGYR